MSIITSVHTTSTPGTIATPIFTPLWPPSRIAPITRLPIPPWRTGRMPAGVSAASPSSGGSPASVPKCFFVKMSISRVETTLPITAPSSPISTAAPSGRPIAGERLYIYEHTISPMPKAVPRLVSAGN